MVKRKCPYCRILMKYLEVNSTYQRPKCKRKFREKFSKLVCGSCKYV